MTFAFANQPVELVVPYGPGGGTDMFARSVQKALLESSNIVTVVVYKPGADGKIGTKYTLTRGEEAPTILVSSASILLINKVFYTTSDYDYTQFDSVVPIAQAPYVLSISAKAEFKTLKEFFEAAKTKPMNCGAGTSASALYLKYMFKSLDIKNVNIVPFKGTNDTLVNLISGNIDCTLDPWPVVAQQFRDGKINVVGVAKETKLSEFPNIPLLKDHIKDFVMTAWFGISIPKTSKFQSREQIISLTQQFYRDKTFVQTIKTLDYDVTVPPADSTKWLDSEYRRHEEQRQRTGIEKTK